MHNNKHFIELHELEKEILLLKATMEMINSMVNYEILELYHQDPYSEICFRSSTHQAFFNIMLVDFLLKPDVKIFGLDNYYLSNLKKICSNPSFNSNYSVSFFKNIIKSFCDWLDQEVLIEKIGSSAINTELNLKLKRLEFLKICGNIYKHNFTRLTNQALTIQNIFKRNKIELNTTDSLLILENFHEWFHSNILNYHASTIAEFLNNIRWGIYEYLQPELYRSRFLVNNDPLRYEYAYPDKIQNPLIKDFYWKLMNDVSTKPYMPKFQVTRFLKIRY